MVNLRMINRDLGDCSGMLEEGLLIEGINDPYIFKVLFTAGGPGSGKSFVADHTVKGLGLKYVASDIIFEKYLKKAGLSLKLGKVGSPLHDKQWKVRTHAKEKTGKREVGWVNGMLGLVVDGTGKSYSKITKHAKMLKANGYDVGMLFVNTSLKTSLERNAARERSIDEKPVREMWNQVHNNLGKFQKFFGNSDFFIIDSNKTYKGADIETFGVGLRRLGLKWLSQPVKNPLGKEIIAQLKATGGKTLSDFRQATQIAASKNQGFINSITG